VAEAAVVATMGAVVDLIAGVEDVTKRVQLAQAAQKVAQELTRIVSESKERAKPTKRASA
jgi:hypothetical protein